MVIRFLQTCPSGDPEYPFMAGQMIEVYAPPPFLLELLDGVRAEVVRTAEPIEVAVQPAYDVPERRRRVKRGSRHSVVPLGRAH